jgi:hypothetical protein
MVNVTGGCEEALLYRFRTLRGRERVIEHGDFIDDAIEAADAVFLSRVAADSRGSVPSFTEMTDGASGNQALACRISKPGPP